MLDEPDGGAERLIWRQIRHLISCTMTCVGGTSVKRPPDLHPFHRFPNNNGAKAPAASGEFACG